MVTKSRCRQIQVNKKSRRVDGAFLFVTERVNRVKSCRLACGQHPEKNSDEQRKAETRRNAQAADNRREVAELGNRLRDADANHNADKPADYADHRRFNQELHHD